MSQNTKKIEKKDMRSEFIFLPSVLLDLILPYMDSCLSCEAVFVFETLGSIICGDCDAKYCHECFPKHLRACCKGELVCVRLACRVCGNQMCDDCGFVYLMQRPFPSTMHTEELEV